MTPITQEDFQHMADFRQRMREARNRPARLGFGNEEQPCQYCHDEPATFDPVLGWIGPECLREQDSDEPQPDSEP